MAPSHRREIPTRFSGLNPRRPAFGLAPRGPLRSPLCTGPTQSIAALHSIDRATASSHSLLARSLLRLPSPLARRCTLPTRRPDASLHFPPCRCPVVHAGSGPSLHLHSPQQGSAADAAGAIGLRFKHSCQSVTHTRRTTQTQRNGIGSSGLLRDAGYLPPVSPSPTLSSRSVCSGLGHQLHVDTSISTGTIIVIVVVVCVVLFCCGGFGQ